ncbi:MAG: LysM peptidoglycan-binding domain-containing protein [Bacteroidetes bacterium]|nr:LysM peptidoglycan-binding domain-containing protein [Bacteroidota bacterium]
MDVAQLLRILRRHILLLILVPIVLALAVWYFTRNQDNSYQSETIIYTGIFSGYTIESTTTSNVDFMGTNMQFDQLVNYLSSRKVIEETSIRLLAQHLMLETYDDKYINKKNYDALQELIPKEIKDLVVKYNKSGAERERMEQIKNLEYKIQELTGKLNKNKGTTSSTASENSSPSIAKLKEDSIKNESVYHIVAEGENIEAIASRYSLTVDELMGMNELQNKEIQPGMKLICKKGGLDGSIYHTVIANEDLQSIAAKYNTTVDNLKVLNSLIDAKVSPGDVLTIGKNSEPESPTNTQVITSDKNSPTSQRIQRIILPDRISSTDYEKTVQNLTNYYHKDNYNFIYQLLNFTHPHYAINSITGQLSTNRIQSSDLIKVTYKCDDPGIAQNTLAILTEVFIRQYKDLKENQTDDVVRYFREQVAIAESRLNEQENRLLRLNQNNNIINYYEQSKSISLEKDALDRSIQDKSMTMQGAAATLRSLEGKLAKKDSIFLKSNKIMSKRNDLASLSEKLEINKVSQGYDPYQAQKMQDINSKITKLKDDIKLTVNELYLYGHTTEGVPIAQILENWLKNVLVYEDSKASINVLNGRKAEFLKTYQIFAPLGAMTKRYERQINVAEQSYIEMKRALNQAMMRQQNLEMSSNMKLVDDPNYPIMPLASKRKLLILAAALLGLFLVAFIIILLEYFDSTIKTPERAERLTGLKLASAFPRYISSYKKADLHAITQRFTDLLLQNIKLKISLMKPEDKKKPLILMFFSTNPETGKSTIANNLVDRLRSTNERVLYMNYTFDDYFSNNDDYNINYTYAINNNFIETESIGQLLGERNLRQDNYIYDYILLELPSIVHHAYPINLMNSVDIGILFVNATDYWRKSDIKALGNLKLVLKHDPLVVLNNAELFALEDIVMDFKKIKKGQSGIFRWLTAPFRIQVKFKE